MSIGSKLGGQSTKRKISKGRIQIRGYLAANQANYIYRKVVSGNLINKKMMRQEIDQDIELDKMDNIIGDENPYMELVNNAGKIETTLSQMETMGNT